MKDRACDWNPEVPCPFAPRLGDNDFVTHEGRRLCMFHAPLAAKSHVDRNWFAQTFRRFQEGDGLSDFSQVEFVGQDDRVQRYEVVREISLRGSKFDARVELVIGGVPSDLTDSEFLGENVVHSSSANYGVLNLSACRFRGNFILYSSGSLAEINLAGAVFGAESYFHNVGNARRLIFTDCHFATAPTFGETADLPRKTYFNGARFGMRADDESSFRAIRNYFNRQRSRDWEGRFYAYEKRCQRLGMTRPEEWFARIFSRLYDWSSEYGYSYGRALVWFFCVQIVFGIAYAMMAGRFGLGGRLDDAVLAFTFAQVAKPFELFGRAPAHDPDAFLPEAGNGWWLALTAAQSVLSIVFIALFLLALRWRFRRE